MPLERPRARRYSSHGSIALANLQSEIQTKEQTSNLGLFGCPVDTLKPLAVGTKVRIRISYKTENFDAFGRVVHTRKNSRMGILCAFLRN